MSRLAEKMPAHFSPDDSMTPSDATYPSGDNVDQEMQSNESGAYGSPFSLADDNDYQEPMVTSADDVQSPMIEMEAVGEATPSVCTISPHYVNNSSNGLTSSFPSELVANHWNHGHEAPLQSPAPITSTSSGSLLFHADQKVRIKRLHPISVNQIFCRSPRRGILARMLIGQ